MLVERQMRPGDGFGGSVPQGETITRGRSLKERYPDFFLSAVEDAERADPDER